MTDLTPLFQQCVSIVQDHWSDEVDKRKLNEAIKQKRKEHLVNDSFIKECNELSYYIESLKGFLNKIKPFYLSIGDESSNEKIRKQFDQNTMDQEFKYKIQEVYEKLKMLQNYEQRRVEASTKARMKSGWFGNLFASEDDNDLYQATVNKHRFQILKYLSNSLNEANASFEDLQRLRIERERQLNSLTFQNIEEDMDLFNYKSNFSLEKTDFDEWGTALEDDTPAMAQQQQQELEIENREFLTMKTNQLKKVQQLHSSMAELLGLQAELSFQLEKQSGQIDNLLESQNLVEQDVKLGNIQLRRASTRNKKGTNIIIGTCIILGLLILFLDYIS